MVKPGGIGILRCAISASPTPLPPKIFLLFPYPSEKEYTYLAMTSLLNLLKIDSKTLFLAL
jgi:hypothetical protein